MGNAWKGTFEAQIGSETYTLRPTFEACIQFEEKAGISITEAFSNMAEKKTSMKIVCAAIWAGILGESIAKNDPSSCPSWDILGEKISRFGISNSMLIAMKWLTYACVSEEQREAIAQSQGEDSEKK